MEKYIVGISVSDNQAIRDGLITLKFEKFGNFRFTPKNDCFAIASGVMFVVLTS